MSEVLDKVKPEVRETVRRVVEGFKIRVAGFEIPVGVLAPFVDQLVAEIFDTIETAIAKTEIIADEDAELEIVVK